MNYILLLCTLLFSFIFWSCTG